MLRTVVIFFVFIAVNRIYCASLVIEKEISNVTLGDLQIRDDTTTWNSSLKVRSRTKRWIEETIETPSSESDSNSYPDIQPYISHSSRGHGHRGTGHGHHTRGHNGHHTRGQNGHHPGSHHGHHPGGHHGHHPGGPHGLHLTEVFMPTGKMANISVPKELKGWKCGTPTLRINLDPHGKYGHREYDLVANVVRSTKKHRHFRDYRFIKIEKIVNGCFWKYYRLSQTVIRNEAGFVNERMLFHGTSKVEDILKKGFDERYTQIMGNMFGAGLYFAEHSSKSNGYAFGNNNGCPAHNDKNCEKCERQMILCRVTLGKMQKETVSKAIANPRPGYNSVKGVATHMQGGLQFPEYIVYRGEQVYPEYVITYKIVN